MIWLVVALAVLDILFIAAVGVLLMTHRTWIESLHVRVGKFDQRLRRLEEIRDLHSKTRPGA